MDQIVVVTCLLKAKLVATDLLPISLLQIPCVCTTTLALKRLLTLAFKCLPVSPAVVVLLPALLLKLPLLLAVIALVPSITTVIAGSRVAIDYPPLAVLLFEFLLSLLLATSFLLLCPIVPILDLSAPPIQLLTLLFGTTLFLDTTLLFPLLQSLLLSLFLNLATLLLLPDLLLLSLLLLHLATLLLLPDLLPLSLLLLLLSLLLLCLTLGLALLANLLKLSLALGVALSRFGCPGTLLLGILLF